VTDGDCDECPPAPPNSVMGCNQNLCDFTCNTGFQKTSDASGCTPIGGTGGTSGTGGSGGGGTGGSGGGGTCNANQCPSCFLNGIGGIACCRSDNRCGCRRILGIFPCQ